MSLILDGTNGLSDVDGSAATPAIRGSDANTGVFFGTDIVGVSTGGTERMRVDASGNVGIGTSSPARLLDVNGAARIASGVYMNNGSGAFVWQEANAALEFATNNTERMRITSAGNVGIGTSSPAYKLDVRGSSGDIARIADGTNADLLFGTNINGPYVFTPTAASLRFGTNNTERARITEGGALIVPYIYNTTSGSAANVIVGSDGNLFRSTSALKYKTDVRDLESIDIDLFRPVRYKSKSEIDDPTKDHIGIIADEVDTIGIKELVTYGSNGEVEGFQYERLTVVLLKAIQELKGINDAQAQIITALTARVEALEGAQA
jgi:hypothetical protein